MGDALDFLVRKQDWREVRFAPFRVPSALEPGQVLFRVDRFALTSNNISYALVGEALGYWRFFPAEAGWGRIPAMGFADVIASSHPDVAEGERVFGFFPMSTHLTIEAEGASPGGFSDAAPHRRETAPVYRHYARTSGQALYRPEHEDALLLLQGLFTTSFLVDDFLAEADFFGARSFVISSASSKTAVALAFLLSRRARGAVVGITSARNAAFVEGLGCYDRTLRYDEIENLPREPVVFVDHSGSGDVVDGLHRHLGENVRHSCMVGGTHWESAGRADDLPGAPPSFFFAPARIQQRSAEWGPGGFQRRLAASWEGFRAWTDGWLEGVRGRGAKQLEGAYREVLEGRAEPRQGHVLSLWEEG